MLSTKKIQQIQKSFQGTHDHLVFIFEALGDATRLKIFRALAQKKELCVTDVANVFRISVPAASYQLKILEMVGLIRKERMGKMICYKLRKEDHLVRNVLKIIQ